jgi:hypothetical protein
MSGMPEPSRRNYFVDEAGDGTLFDAKGRVLIGTEGCSRYFILGLADIDDPDGIGRELQALRIRLLADPYFAGVPSMQSNQHKTATVFHAKDDLPEVRREVFSVLLRHNIRFFAVVRSKARILEYVRGRNKADHRYHYNSNELYDHMVRRLFRDRLHKDGSYDVLFATRGNSNRTAALQKALDQARGRFSKRWGITSEAPIKVKAVSPVQAAGLQATDYMLWALQRLYERREDRYVQLLWRHFCLVHDVDDTRFAEYGVYYTKKKPLTLAALGEVQGI